MEIRVFGSVTLASSFQDRGTSISWRSNSFDTQPKNQIEASKQQHHHNLYWDLSRASAQVSLHTVLLGVNGVTYTPHTLKPRPFKRPLTKLGLDTHKATKLALKLHAHSIQYAYKLVTTRRALESTSLNPNHQGQAQGTASNPPSPH
eukprot:1158398-Pelagomonas_calceolata.AAC.2